MSGGLLLGKGIPAHTRVYLVSGLGNFTYQISKYLSVFFTTMIIFTVPFLLEILLNCLSFPLAVTGDFIGGSMYGDAYRMGVNHYFMKNIYLCSPYLYAIIGTLFWGAASGLLGVFTAAVSSLIRVKYNVFLFLPVFVMLNLSTILARSIPEGMPSIKWYSLWDYM